MIRYPLLLAALLAGTAHSSPIAGDAAEGQRLHAENCIGCHDASVYTRKDRKISSSNGLVQQMEACAHAAQKDFTATQKQSIAKFLNDRYYHFRQ